MRRFLPLILIALAAAMPLGCGGDDETTVTDTVTTTPSVTTEDTGTEPTSTETSTTGGKIGPGETGGEIADLPLCSQGPPPCRNADGSVIEP
jgi:hypothetical protein